METIVSIVGLIALIVFFVMAAALRNISSAVRDTNRIVRDWSQETGIGFRYKCSKCKKSYQGKKEFCPHCGEEVKVS